MILHEDFPNLVEVMIFDRNSELNYLHEEELGGTIGLETDLSESDNELELAQEWLELIGAHEELHGALLEDFKRT